MNTTLARDCQSYEAYIVSDVLELDSHRESWDAIISSLPNANPFQTLEWVTSWLASFWRDKPLSFVFIEDGHSVVGVAPFLPDECGSLWCPRTLVNPSNPHAKRIGVLLSDAENGALNTLLRFLVQQRKNVPLAFPQMEDDHNASSLLSLVGERSDLRCRVRWQLPSPILRITTDWDSFLQTKSRRFRKELRRKQKKMHRSGAVEIRLVTDPEKVSRAFADVLAIESKSWKHAAGTSFCNEPGVRDLYSSFAVKGADRGWLRLHVLYLDSKPIAHIYGILLNNNYFALKTSYDETYKSISPGIVLFAHAIREAFEQRLSTFDFLGEESRWKLEFANDFKSHFDLCLYERRNMRCNLCKFCHNCVKMPLKRVLKPVIGEANRSTIR